VEIFLFYLLSNFLGYVDIAADPVNEAWLGRQRARQLDCERLSQAEAHDRFPDRIPASHPRATALMEVDALVCHHRLLEDDQRPPREALILDGLGDEVDELGSLAIASVPADAPWVVDAYYPDLVMTRKIATASRVALAERGVEVSDAPPRLTAGDVEVLRTLPMRDALPLACRRLHESGALVNDAGRESPLLAVALLDPQETQLHAGTCVRGEFRWLR